MLLLLFPAPESVEIAASASSKLTIIVVVNGASVVVAVVGYVKVLVEVAIAFTSVAQMVEVGYA